FGQPLFLVSDSPGTQWSIAPQSTKSVSFVDVQDSNSTTAISAATSHDSGDNTNWTFTAASRTWTGAVSFDWGTAGNWSAGYVPNDIDDVTVAALGGSVLFEPKLDTDRTANKLTINSGATLNLAGNDLTLTGAFSNSGTVQLEGVENITGVAAGTG